MGVFDVAGDWFAEEEKKSRTQSRTEKVKYTEEDIMDMLNQMEQSEQSRFEHEKQEYIDRFIPKKPEFEYKEVDIVGDDELYRQTVSELRPDLDREKQEAREEYSRDMAEVEGDRERATLDAEEKKEEARAKLGEDISSFRTDALKNNIYDSSIVGSNVRKLSDITEQDIEDIMSELGYRLAETDSAQGEAEAALAKEIEKLKSQYDKAVQTSYDKKKREQQTEADRVTKENASTAKREQEYNEQVETLRREKAKEYDDFLKDMLDKEKKYGYDGARKKEYDKRLDLAMSYYSKLPKEQALEQIGKNQSLSRLLGYNYITLLNGIRNA